MNNNDWLDIDVLEDYLDGKLDAKAMHRVERLSLEDPFVAEALAGLSQSPKRNQTLSILQKQLQERVAQKPIEEKRWRITSHRLSIAAAAAVLFVTVSLLFWMRESNHREQQAANLPKKVDIAIAPPTGSGANTKTKPEVDKLIADAKTSVYANIKKVEAKKSSRPVIAAVLSAPTVETIADKKIETVTYDGVFKKNATVANETLAGVRIRGVYAQNTKDSIAIRGLSSESKLSFNQIKGTVYGEDKSPIRGADVKLAGTSIATSTNAKGEFTLMVDSMLKNRKLSIGSIGFRQKEIDLKTTKNLSIELQPDENSLSEVVIIPTAKQAKQQTITGAVAMIPRPAEPVGGWESFESYLIANNRLLKDKQPTEKYLTLSFRVDKVGRPTDIKVVNSSSHTKAEEKEAIRLLEKGPRWTLPPSVNPLSTEVSVIIKF